MTVKNSKGILKDYDLVTWPVHLLVAIGDMEKEINQLYKPADNSFDTIGPPCPSGATTYTLTDKKGEGYYNLVWYPVKGNVCIETIAHEAGHVALEIFQYTDSKVHFDNQEPLCYLIGSVARLISMAMHELIKKEQKPKKTKNDKGSKDV